MEKANSSEIEINYASGFSRYVRQILIQRLLRDMKYVLPCLILINCCSLQVSGGLEWTVIRKVTDYGQNVTLFCNVSNCCPKTAGWDRYSPEQRTLFIDLKTIRPKGKYDGKVTGDGYTLIIQNLTKSDLNVSYACVYGATIGEIKDLLEEDVFKYINSTQPIADINSTQPIADINSTQPIADINSTQSIADINSTQPNVSTGKSKFPEGEIAGFIAGPTVTIVVLLLMCKIVPKINRYRNRNRDRGRDRDRDNNDLEEDVRLVEVNRWPDLLKGLPYLNKRDIVKCTEDLRTKICKSKHGKVYHMTGKKKGKVLTISNVQCSDQSIEAKAVNRWRRCVDFDKTSLSQLFTYMQYESKQSYTKRDVSEEEMKTFLATQLENEDNSTFDSLVIVFYSGGMEFKPDCIYDTNGKEIDKDGILEMIRQSKYFKDKPKIVIIRTYDFKEETETGDVLDAVSHELHFYKRPNKDDLFVVSSQPRTNKGPWVIGDGMNGSYFIQALVHVFKNMAHEKSFMEMMEEVNTCIMNAMVPKQGKTSVAEVMILEHSVQKSLFFFPGLLDVPPVMMKVPDWPDLAAGGKFVKKTDIIPCTKDFLTTIQESKKIYSMTSVKKGKFFMISNAHCNCLVEENQTKEEKEKFELRYGECIMHTDFDKSNMSQLFKFMGYDTTGGMHIKKTKEEIKDFLKTELNEIDKDQSVKYDSLVILFLSGKFDCEPGKIYDCNGDLVSRKDILDIMKGSTHFKGKPKICIVQTYNFQEESKPYDATDSAAANDIIKGGDLNKDDIFMVSSYPRIEQGPWMIGDKLSGSYFIQALVHVFMKSACEKSFNDLLKEANSCLLQAVVPNKKDSTVEKTSVAQIVLLEHCEEKELYFFPGLTFKASDFTASMLGNLVSQPTD